MKEEDPETCERDEEVHLISIPRMKRLLTRRAIVAGLGTAAASGLVAATWKHLSKAEDYEPLLDIGDVVGQRIQRIAMLGRGRPLAVEYRADQISLDHPVNGGFGAPWVDKDSGFDQMAARGFKDWRLKLRGLVVKPSEFTLADIRNMPRRTQITMHSCDAGWSAIGQWTGVPLGWLLTHVGMSPRARYVVFYALDKIGGVQLFDSIDLFDAFHPQTILAHRFNGTDLPVGHGAPLRLRVELQIGYKNVKHLERIEVVDSLANVAGGRGGMTEQSGYQWYAGQ
jgi:DMSO/TMAO reductase YedYZ molybdopterin-dependent catalytic subunit